MNVDLPDVASLVVTLGMEGCEPIMVKAAKNLASGDQCSFPLHVQAQFRQAHGGVSEVIEQHARCLYSLLSIVLERLLVPLSKGPDPLPLPTLEDIHFYYMVGFRSYA